MIKFVPALGLAERIGLDRFCADIDQALAAARALSSRTA